MPGPTRTLAQYLALFPTRGQREAALKHAQDVRKFEIDLYWKRATYFWTLIAALFAGYFVLQGTGSFPDSSHVVACLGLILSVAWYLVGRGSKFWQQNWEFHLDCLEDDFTGPLHKTVFNQEELSFLQLIGPYPYSPSKINQTVGLSVIAIWFVLIFSGSTKYLPCLGAYFSTYWWTVGIVFVAILILLFGCKTSKTSNVNFTARTRSVE